MTGYASDGAPASYLYNAANSLTALDAGSPGTSVPEVPFIVLLPHAAFLIFGLYWLGRRRKMARGRSTGGGSCARYELRSGCSTSHHRLPASPSVTANYAYNGDGLRLVKTVNGVTHALPGTPAPTPPCCSKTPPTVGQLATSTG